MPKLKRQSKSQRTKKQIELMVAKRNQNKMQEPKYLTSINSTDEPKQTSCNKNDRHAENIIVTPPTVIVGDFSQFSIEFPLPHHQCTAMSAVALALASFKSIVTWDSNDVNNIIRAGQIYYENCISYQNVVDSDYDETFLNPIDLLQNIEIYDR